MTIIEAVSKYSQILKNTDEPVREARLLIGLELGMSISEIIINGDFEISEKQLNNLDKKVKRRAEGEPFAYISGEKAFMGYNFKVNPHVLIPRAETEFLVMVVEEYGVSGNARVLDLCTGSGCVAISLAKRLKNAEVTAVDVSEKALLLARENAENLGANVNFIRKDIIKNKIKFENKFMLAVSNPPYIETKTIENLQKDVKNYEPSLALDGGEDGLLFYKKIVQDAELFLEEGGRLIFEIGYNQGDAVKAIMAEQFDEITVTNDYAGHPRVVSGVIKKYRPHTHYGHRERLRERFISDGLSSFQQHEMLELLLSYAIPRRDVNEIAHRLINRFGGISKVLDATVDDLEKVGEISRNTAVLLSSIPHFAKAYRMDKWKTKPNFESVYTAGKFAIDLFVGTNYEESYIICLDNKCGFLNCEKLTEGTINETAFYPRLVVEIAIRNKANKIVITHNHPSGILEPSWSDKEVTKRIKSALDNIDITLVDHIIVGGEQFTSMKELNLI